MVLLTDGERKQRGAVTEMIGADGFVQLFVHNGCVVPARSHPGFDPFPLRGQAAVFRLAYPRSRRGDVANEAPRNPVCRGYGTSRSGD
jgi:hypothetical protein